MERKKLFKILACLIILIFAADFAAHKFHWYFSIWYFDMLMHFLGGFWISLVLIWLWSGRDSFRKLSANPIFKILSGVLIIGVLWEVFELIVNNTIAQNPFDVLDTASDLFFDLAGGTFSAFYFFKKIALGGENEIQ